MDSDKKEVYQAASEVLGLCLKHFANNQDYQKEIKNIVLKQLQKMKKFFGTKPQEKFMSCLYMVFQHFPDIVEHFASTFVYDMSHVPKGLSLKQAVEMLQVEFYRITEYSKTLIRSRLTTNAWLPLLEYQSLHSLENLRVTMVFKFL